ncbi:MAG TPA: hypothetical protein VEF06_03965 [Bryobacteraceae bacterium]|nr:hypothetical protein [Bryobacteraceae bacterium]
MKALVTGSGGLIGSDRHLSIDIRDCLAIGNLFEAERPALIIHIGPAITSAASPIVTETIEHGKKNLPELAVR